MDKTLQDFLDGMQTPTSKLTIKQLREREELWRALWSWLDDDVKFYLLRAGTLVKVVRRDYKASVGMLNQVKFELSEVEVDCFEKTYNYQDGKWYFEKKVVKMPKAAFSWLESVYDQQLAEEEESPEVAPIADLEGVS